MSDFQLSTDQIQDAKKHPEFLRAVELLQQKRFVEADAACQKLGRQLANSPDALHVRSVIAFGTKRLPDAIDLVQKALQLRGNDAAMLSDYGNFLFASGDYANAETYLAKALQAAPSFAGAHFNMGCLARAVGNMRRAEYHFIQAYQCDANMLAALFNLIDVQIELPRLQNAYRNAKQIVKAHPGMAKAHTSLSKVLAAQGDKIGADTALRNARTLAPKETSFMLEQADFFARSGRLPEATALLQKVLESDPNNVSALAALSRYSKPTLDDPLTKNLQIIASSKGGLPSDLAMVHYALGAVMENNGRYAEAFESFSLGAREKRKNIGINSTQLRPSPAELSKAFTPEVFARMREKGVADETPIFVVGLPRSGTTLTEQVLASHPDVAGAGELAELKNVADGVAQLAQSSSLGEISAEEISEAAHAYLDTLKTFAPDARRIVDKMPDNFLQIGLISILFPNAKIVHCQRNIIDTALSIFKTHFSGNAVCYGYDLDELAGYCRDYQQVMKLWETLLPGRIYHHSYDVMVQDQEGQSRALIDACGLEWSDACLSFHKNSQLINTASIAQVRQPIYSKSSGLADRYGAVLDPLRAALDKFGVDY